MPPIPKAPPSVPERKLYSRTHPETPDDEIVITGVAGKFPNSKNVEEFAHNLYHKVSEKRFIFHNKKKPVEEVLPKNK